MRPLGSLLQPRDSGVSDQVVVPVPDSAAHATIGFVEENVRLGYPCIQDLGFFRNPYVGRSFIAPSQVEPKPKPYA